MLSGLFRRSRLPNFSTESELLNKQPVQSKASSSRFRISNINKRFPLRVLLLVVVVFVLLVSLTRFFSFSINSILSNLVPTSEDPLFSEDLNSTSFHLTNSSSISNHSTVRIWAPVGSCKGLFVSSQAKHSVHNLPYAIIRDAVVDRRLLSREQFRKANPSLPTDLPFERIILYLTLHLSVRLTKNEAQAVLTRSLNYNRSDNVSEHLNTQTQSLIKGLRTNVDFVTHADPFVFNKKKYHPKYRTTHNRQVSEWQIAISIAPDLEMNSSPYKSYSQKQFTEFIRQLSVGSNPASFNFGFTLRRYDGEQFRFNPTMSLACATGWELDPVFPPLKEMSEEPRCAKGAWRVGGSVAISGKALYGDKSRDSKHYYEIAQFAARALRGPVRFNAALVAVVVNSSLSDISYRCAVPPKGETTEQCEQRYHDQNLAHLTKIRNVVEQELEALNVDRRLFSKVVIMPFCRLGTDAAHSERDNPCKESHRHAQYHATFYSYAMVAPYYRVRIHIIVNTFPRNYRTIFRILTFFFHLTTYQFLCSDHSVRSSGR